MILPVVLAKLTAGISGVLLAILIYSKRQIKVSGKTFP